MSDLEKSESHDSGWTPSYYDYTGIIIPGAWLVLLFLVFFRWNLEAAPLKDLNLGELGALVAITVVSGYFLMFLGEWWVNTFIWAKEGGLPSAWVRRGHAPLLTAVERRLLAEELGVDDLRAMSDNDWKAAFRQLRTEVAVSGRSAKSEVLNGNYSLIRGVITANFICATVFICTAIYKAVSPPQFGPEQLKDALIISLTAGSTFILIGVMQKYCILYAEEIYTEFLFIRAQRKERAVADSHYDPVNHTRSGFELP